MGLIFLCCVISLIYSTILYILWVCGAFVDSKGKQVTIGIDLGTTYTRVAVWSKRNRAELVKNKHGSPVMPSMVVFTDNGEPLVGKDAKDQAFKNPSNTIYDIKRLIGRTFTDLSTSRDSSLRPYTVITPFHDKPMIVTRCNGTEKRHSTDEAYSFILKKIKNIVEDQLRSTVKDAVITVPSSFTDSEREATKLSGAVAGLNVMSIIDESAAIGISYCLDKKDGSKKKLLVFDLGGGSLDVSVLVVKKGSFKVKATAGDARLGGEDFTNRLVLHCIKQFKTENSNNENDILKNPKALLKLRDECEKIKKILSSKSQATIKIESLNDTIGFKGSITRQKFVELNMDLFRKCMKIVAHCLREAQMEHSEIDEVVLLGGSSKIPCVQEVLGFFFDGKELCDKSSVDEVVAHGAAIQAAILSGNCRENIQNLTKICDHPVSVLDISTKEMNKIEDAMNKAIGETRAGMSQFHTITRSISTTVTDQANQPNGLIISSTTQATADYVIERLDLHRHKLKIMPCQTPFECNGCGQRNFKHYYNCVNEIDCEYKLHKECADPISSKSHPFLKNCNFTFYQKVPGRGTGLCEACGKDVKGFGYQCQHKDGHNLHPNCMQLHMIRFNPNPVKLELRKELPSKCSICGSHKISRWVKGWCFVFKVDNDVGCFHVTCVKEAMFEDWVKTRSGSTSLTEINDELLEAIACKPEGGGGRIWKKRDNWKKVAVIVVKFIIYSLIGDPITPIIALVDAFAN